MFCKVNTIMININKEHLQGTLTSENSQKHRAVCRNWRRILHICIVRNGYVLIHLRRSLTVLMLEQILLYAIFKFNFRKSERTC